MLVRCTADFPVVLQQNNAAAEQQRLIRLYTSNVIRFQAHSWTKRYTIEGV